MSIWVEFYMILSNLLLHPPNWKDTPFEESKQ